MSKTEYKNINGINVISLTGDSLYDMGVSYGKTMQNQLIGALDYLIEGFEKHKITKSEMVKVAVEFYDRYSDNLKPFLHGMSEGAEITMDEANILNGMETLNKLLEPSYYDLRSEVVNCAFMLIPPSKTNSGNSIIARNYDFPRDIYGEIAMNLTVTILNQDNKIPTALIGMPGQIYCPSCTNKNGLFMELNNGMPSGGTYVNQTRESMLTQMVNVLQESKTLDVINAQMLDKESDYSLIISTANSSYVQSFEYSSNSTLGMKPYYPQHETVLVYTNFYLNNSWGNEIPKPTDETTWMGITRRNNLENLASKSSNFTFDDVKNLMLKNISEGGAYWNLTIYQIIADLANNTISLRRALDEDQKWVDIYLDEFYDL